MLRQRILSAVLLVPIVLIAVYLGGPWFAGLIALAAFVAGYELVQMSGHAGHAPSLPIVLGLIAGLLLVSVLPGAFLGSLGSSNVDLTWAVLAAALLLTFAWQVFLPEDRRSVTNWALTLAGGLYVGVLTGHFIALRNVPGGLGWTAWALVATWANDSGAYVAGKTLGRHKFSPHLSPNKTWEGSIGGWLACLAVSLAFGVVLHVPLWQAALLGIVVAPVGTLGDLAVSFLKRQVGVKDTGHLIPGHGGILDRLDSLLFVVAVVYYWVLWK